MGDKVEISQRALVAGLLVLCACGGSAAEGDDDLTLAVSRPAATWVPLGGNLSPDSAALVTALTLASDPRPEPVLALSTLEPATQVEHTVVLRWHDSGWAALGEPLPALGPSLALDRRRHEYVCTGGAGPFVSRWDGARWLALGGNIGEETGYKGGRYQVDRCGGIVIDGSGAPIVAWSADVGAKANVVYAARWNRSLHKWEGLGAGSIGGRATSAYLDIDAQDRLYVAAYSPGGSYGGGATTRVWRWSGSSWSQLGADLPGTDSPVVGVYEDAAYLALYDNASDGISVLRWHKGSWLALPSPGRGTLPALDFTPSGKPVIAYVEGDPTTSALLQVKYLSDGVWRSAGTRVADATGQLIDNLELSLDSHGRPSIAWSLQDAQSGKSGVFVRRYEAALR